jgi:23S rRNA (uridine2552-2'-O)-methyltransferase
MLVQMMREDGVWGDARRSRRDDESEKWGRGERELKVRVKSKRKSLSSHAGSSASSTIPTWRAPSAKGFRSRAAFKLIEIDDKHHLLQAGARVLDLGARPAAGARWRPSASARAAASSASTSCDGRDSRRRFAQIDFLDPDAPDSSSACSAARRRGAVRHGGQRHRPSPDRSSQDHGAGRGRGGIRRRGAQARRRVSRQGDPGRHESALLAALKRDFAAVKHVKPAASRADSAELYVLATGFRGACR